MSTPPFDVDILERYLRDRGVCAGPITLQPIGDGHSNLTYLIDDGRGRAVIRRPPPPPIPPGGHDVLREARIQSALADTPVPVPTILATQAAGPVMDSPFYLMEHLEGVVATTETPKHLDTPGDRRGLAETMVDTLVELHRVDYQAVGLADFGRPSNDVDRHLRRFSRIIDPKQEGLDGQLGALLDQLIEGAPEPQPPTIVHGDFRLGNVMIAPDAPPRLLAVLDWELATIGDPLRDLGYFLATYAIPEEPLHPLTAMGSATLAEGYPGRRELAQRYARLSGRDVTNVSWYLVMALWKLAVLFEYQRQRVVEGIGDPYYARPGLVEELLTAARHVTTGMSA
jgi:aminoglycoside phosphotransferase (APT) family kinase protein